MDLMVINACLYVSIIKIFMLYIYIYIYAEHSCRLSIDPNEPTRPSLAASNETNRLDLIPLDAGPLYNPPHTLYLSKGFFGLSHLSHRQPGLCPHDRVSPACCRSRVFLVTVQLYIASSTTSIWSVLPFGSVL
jgi:hypothetical protein